MMGSAVARTADECEYIRWGDDTIHIGYGKKRKHSTCRATYPTKGDFYANGAGFTHCGKERILELLVTHWDGWRRGYMMG